MTTDDHRPPHLGPIKFLPQNAQTAASAVLQRALDRTAAAVPVRLINVNTLANASSDANYDEIIRQESINFADGAPIRLLLRLLNRKSIPALRGPDLFRHTLHQGQALSVRHFLYGGSTDTLNELQSRIEETWPSTIVAGSFAPPFRPLSSTELEALSQAIRLSQPHIIWVGLGSQKQDKEAARLAALHNVTAVGVGAAFDFLLGTVPEAPTIYRRLGAEWLFRLVHDPRRLWRRYLVESPKMLLWVWRNVLVASRDRAQLR